MTMPTEFAATRRTFIIRRKGDFYEIMRVFEASETMTLDSMMEEALAETFSTEADERIIAEQTFAVFPADESGIVRVVQT